MQVTLEIILEKIMEMQNEIKDIKKEQKEIKQELSKMVTKEDLARELSKMVTKEDLARELSKMVTKEDLARELSKMVTKEYLAKELKKYVTKEYLKGSLDDLSKAIAEELRNIVKFMCERQDKQFKDFLKSRNENIDYFIKTNKVEHDAYNAKLYKIELGQSSLEEKVFDIENKKNK